jgi:cysteine desulfurase/selenocysteine lyase
MVVSTLNPHQIREQFPILRTQANGIRLAYLDSAASSQKPEPVLAAMEDYYRNDYANVHRGVYRLAERSTEAYERARERVAHFFNISDTGEIVFVRNTTEAINLVAYSWAATTLGPGDIIVSSVAEHHSNIVPWQIIASRTGAEIAFIDIDEDGRLRLDQLDEQLATGQVRLVAVQHVSNMLGTIHPVEDIIARAHAGGSLVLLDGAQSAPHMVVDLSALGADFYACSGHKMCGPMGSGVLYGRRGLLEAMPPFLGGGDMIRKVELSGSSWADLPAKFEAGTPSVADAVGLGAACEYLSGLGLDNLAAHEHALTEYAYAQLRELPGIEIYGPPPSERAGVIAFNLAGAHPHDIGSILDEDDIAIRAGHHCTQPLHDRLGLTASARASFYAYNSFEDVDRLVAGLERVGAIFGNNGA